MFKAAKKVITSLVVICSAIVLIPLGILAFIILAPFIILMDQLERLSVKKDLRKRIEEHHGVIFFLYSDYNNFDFGDYFKANHDNIKVVKVKTYENDPFIKYLNNNCLAQCYPKLVKVHNETLIEKRHYNSFKNFYKRKEDINSFFALIEQSINNLEGEYSKHEHIK